MVEQLINYITENSLHERALKGFWVAFNNWKNNHQEEYNESFAHIPLDDLHVFVHSIGLRASEWPDCDYRHITVSVIIHYNGEHKGNYTAWFALSDDISDDDFLEIW